MRWLTGLFLWHSLIYTLNAYDLSQIREPLNPLKVALDYSLATIEQPKGKMAKANFAWSSHLTFRQPVSDITDGQLWQLAFDAFAEMYEDATQYGIGTKRVPTAMSVLVWGNEIIIASSIKGPAFNYMLKDTPVLESLELCQIVWRDTVGPDIRHKNNGSCGELTAAQIYYSVYSKPLSSQSASVGTVGYVTHSTGTRIDTKPPCGDPKEV